MNCHDTKPYLSPYYDRQLTGEMRQTVAAHIGTCPACRRELETFANLSKLTESSFAEVSELDLHRLLAPEDLWSRIESFLEAAPKTTPRAMDIPKTGVPAERKNPEGTSPEIGRPARRFPWPRIGAQWERAALAALLLIAMGAGVFWFQGSMEHQHEPQGRLARYINAFVRDTGIAQQLLVADYGAKRVDLREASRFLGYEPVIPNRLPEGYSLEAIYVFEMDCCNCAQYVCHREGADPITIFEHGDAHAAHLANCPTRETHCRGQRCQMAKLGKDWIASWQVGPRQITVVGVQDIQEVEHLMDHFSQPESSNSEQGA